MKRTRPPYLKQKLRLYVDHNFPQTVVESVRQDSFWRDKATIETAADARLEGRDDGDHLAHCRREGLILVTLDGDFMDDRRYPIGHQTPGIIQIVSSSEGDIFDGLATILLFLTRMPLPPNFATDAKFQVSKEGTVMRGRDATTREVKTLHLKDGMPINEIGEHFGYF